MTLGSELPIDITSIAARLRGLRRSNQFLIFAALMGALAWSSQLARWTIAFAMQLVADGLVERGPALAALLIVFWAALTILPIWLLLRVSQAPNVGMAALGSAALILLTVSLFARPGTFAFGPSDPGSSIMASATVLSTCVVMWGWWNAVAASPIQHLLLRGHKARRGGQRIWNLQWRSPVPALLSALLLVLAWVFSIAATVPLLILAAALPVDFVLRGVLGIDTGFDDFAWRALPGSDSWQGYWFGRVLGAGGGTLLAVWIAATMGGLLRMTARWLNRRSFERQARLDPRPPILFLRSFDDDQVTLPQHGHFFWRALAGRLGKRRLDHILTESFAGFGPVVAIGRPGETQLPFGAARLYVSDEAWRDRVLELIERAAAVVIVAGSTRGVDWELNSLLGSSNIAKTLIVAPPNSLDLRQNVVASAWLATQTTAAQRISFAFVSQGRCVTLATHEASPEIYEIALRAFFRRDEIAKSYT